MKEATQPDCLHCMINEVVDQLLQRSLEQGKTVESVEIASKIAESLADFILTSVPEDDQARLIAVTIQHFGSYLLEKAGTDPDEMTH